MSLKWADAEVVNAKAVEDVVGEDVLKTMIAAIVDSIPRITDAARTRLALHMVQVYRGSSVADPTSLRTFCALPSLDSDEKLVETPEGTAYLTLRAEVAVDPVLDEPQLRVIA